MPKVIDLRLYRGVESPVVDFVFRVNNLCNRKDRSNDVAFPVIGVIDNLSDYFVP